MTRHRMGSPNMATEILIADDEVTFIRTSSTGKIDVVPAPLAQVREQVCPSSDTSAS